MDHDPWRIDETLSAPALRRRLARQTCVGLTLLWHPDRSRIGAQAALIAKPGEVFPLNRLAPMFFDPAARPSAKAGQPLMDRSVSRTPIGLTLNRDGGVLLKFPTAVCWFETTAGSQPVR
ncbi:MAG: hypothetical protein IPK97_01945 [Ahniella sp.]|nr:hypothetical protein [Ahniella sp.]